MPSLRQWCRWRFSGGAARLGKAAPSWGRTSKCRSLLTSTIARSYLNLGWVRATVVLTKSQIGLGVLGELAGSSALFGVADSPYSPSSGIPTVFATVGMAPGLIMLIAIALMTSWSSYVGTLALNAETTEN